jgi:hypothetical protein
VRLLFFFCQMITTWVAYVIDSLPILCSKYSIFNGCSIQPCLIALRKMKHSLIWRSKQSCGRSLVVSWLACTILTCRQWSLNNVFLLSSFLVSMPASIFLGNPKKTAQHQLLVVLLSQKLGKHYVRFRLKKRMGQRRHFFHVRDVIEKNRTKQWIDRLYKIP